MHRDSHDVGFVHGGDVAPEIVPRILKGKLRDALARPLSNELDALHNSIHNLKQRKSCLAERVWQQPGPGLPAVCRQHHPWQACTAPAAKASIVHTVRQ